MLENATLYSKSEKDNKLKKKKISYSGNIWNFLVIVYCLYIVFDFIYFFF